MIGSDAEQTHELSFPQGGRPTGLCDAQGVNRIEAFGWFDATDLLPFDAIVPVDLIPTDLPDLVERIQGGMALGFLQREQIFLKDWVVQIKPNSGARVIRRHGTVARLWLAEHHRQARD